MRYTYEAGTKSQVVHNIIMSLNVFFALMNEAID